MIKPAALSPLTAPPSAGATLPKVPLEAKPQDPVDSAARLSNTDAAEEPKTGHSVRTGVKVAAAVGLALAGVGFLAGCTDVQPRPAPPESSIVTEFYTQADFKVEVVPEGMQRVDVVRGTHTETVERTVNGETRKESRTVKNDYSPFGVYLGDGLFYDLNGNLVEVPQRAFGQPLAPQEFHEVKHDPEGWANTTIARQDGTTVRIDEGWGTGETVITREGGRITIDPSGWGNSTEITRKGNHTDIDPSGWGNTTAMDRTREGVQVDPAGWGNTTHVRLGQDRVEVDPEGWSNSTVITQHGNQIKIDPDGWANDTIITRTDGEIRINHPGLGGETVIRLEPNRATIDPVGWGNTTVVEWK